MNMVVLIGRLVRDPSYSEVETEKGKYHIASFYLAVPRNFNKGVNYIKITTFGKQADFARDYLTKGKRVAILGELMIGSYKDKETDKTVYTTEVTASRLEFADGKDASGNTPIPFPEADADGFQHIPDGYGEELPFGIGEVIGMIGDDHVPGKVIPLFHDIIFSHFCCHGKFQIRSFRRTAKRRDEFLFIRLIWIRDIGHSLFHCRFDWKDLNVSHIFLTISFSSSISCGVAVPTVFATLASWLMFTPILCIS